MRTGGISTEKAKEMLESLGRLQEEGQAGGLPCPRCGHDRMHPNMVRNALSRYAKVYICEQCGMEEALLDYLGKKATPFKEWGMILGFDAANQEEKKEGGNL